MEQLHGVAAARRRGRVVMALGTMLAVVLAMVDVGASLAWAGQATSSAPPAVVAPTYTWPELHNSRQLTGVSRDPAVSTVTAPTLGVKWMAPVGASLDSPVAAWSSTLKTTVAYQGGKSGYFDAVNVATGQLLWSDYLGAAITSSPLIADGSVWIAPSGGGHLYKIDAATGAVSCEGTITDSVLSTPVLATPPGGVATVYFASLGSGTTNGPVEAYAASDCASLWSWSNYVISGQNSGVWAPLSYVVDAAGVGLLVFGSANPDSRVYALNAETGKVVWRFATYCPPAEDWDVGAGVNLSQPGVNGFADGMAYVEGKDGILYALDLTTGAPVWQYNFGGNTPTNPTITNTDALSTPALSGTTLVFGDITGLYAVNAVTGAREWFDPGTGDVNSSPAIVGPPGARVAAYGDLNGIFHVVQLSNGKSLYSYQTGNFITSSPADVQGNLLVDSDDGFLYDFAPGGGNGSPPTTSITAPADGSTLANPGGSVVLGGSASAADGVSAVTVQVQRDGSAGPWFDQSQGSFEPGLATATATLASPGATTTAWSLTVPVSSQAAAFTVSASAVGSNGVADTTAYSGTTGSAAIRFSVEASGSAPSVVVTPTRVAPGGTMTVSGAGFAPGEPVVFSAQLTTGGTATLVTLTADQSGATSTATVPLPANSAFGPDLVTATGDVSGLTGTGSVYVSNDDPQSGYGPEHTGVEPNDPVIAHYQAVSESTKLSQQWSVIGGSGFDTTPAIVSGIAYIGDEAGNLRAVAMTTGDSLFTVPLGSPIESSPAVASGDVYVGDDAGALHCLDATTGATVWSASLGGAIASPTVAGSSVYVGSSNGDLVALGQSTGTVAWTDPVGGPVASAPAVDPVTGRVVVTTQLGVVAAVSAGGTPVWKDDLNGALTGAMISGGTVFVASSAGSLYAIDEATGATDWTADTGSAISASPILAYGMVTVGNKAGAVSYFRPTTGALVSTQAFFGHPITGITATDSIILLTSSSGHLGMIQGPKYVRMTWLFTGGAAFAAPGVFLNGDVFVAGTDGLLRGFTTPGRPMT